tara:strand:- start:234 stop:689 length:456 start_codon:yes stop_codon:yes gene_type:complete
MSLAHGGDRGLAWQSIFHGVRVGFSNIDLFQDARELRPTFILCMSEMYITLHANYNRKIVSWFEQTYPHLTKELPPTKDLPPEILKRLAHHFAEKIDPKTGSSISLTFRRVRKSLENNVHLIMMNTQLALRARTQVRFGHTLSSLSFKQQF